MSFFPVYLQMSKYISNARIWELKSCGLAITSPEAKLQFLKYDVWF